MFCFEAGGTLQGVAGTAAAITVTVTGVSTTAAGVESPIGLLYQGQLPASAGVLFTVPAGQSWIVKTINITNATASSVSGVQLFQNGAAAANSLIGPITMAGHYTLTGSENGWAMTDAAGVLQISGGGGGGGGTVTSVGLSMPAEFTISGSPVTGSGTLTAAKANQAINTVYAGPNSGSPGSPSFRALVPADLPVATISALGAVKPDGTSITISGGVISSSGGSGALTKIAQVVLSSPAVSIDFPGVPGTYSNLVLTLSAQTANATADDVLVRFNGDAGSNYDWCFGLSGGSSGSGSTAATTSIHIFAIPSTTLTSRVGSGRASLINYASALFKTIFSQSVNFNGTNVFNLLLSGDWKNTAAITDITMVTASGSNFATGAVATLYGES